MKNTQIDERIEIKLTFSNKGELQRIRNGILGILTHIKIEDGNTEEMNNHIKAVYELLNNLQNNSSECRLIQTEN